MPDLDQIFRRPLLFVAGKGGVGKTTVACALAVEAARRGKRVLLCEVDGIAQAARLFGVPSGEAGKAVDVLPRISLMAIEGKAALDEYLRLILPAGRFLAAVFRSRIYQYFVAAAPGLRELMTMGKIWYEVDRTDPVSGGSLRDIVIVDAPATGHSLQYLRMPAAARDAFASGLVHREAHRLVERLMDPRSTSINLVTTPEEMPVNETTSMFEQLRDELGMPTGILFVNRLHTCDISAAEVRRLEDGAGSRASVGERKSLLAVAAAARWERGWAKVHAGHLKRLSKAVPMPTLHLPFLFSDHFGLQQVAELSEHLSEATAPPARRKGSV